MNTDTDNKTGWKVSDVSNPIFTSEIEFQDNKGEWQHFVVIATQDRIVFGGACNAGFLESGFIAREEDAIDETLAELLADLETYYNDGAQYVSRIVCNERM